MFEKKKNDCIYAVTVRGKGSKELFIDVLKCVAFAGCLRRGDHGKGRPIMAPKGQVVG